MIYTPLTIKAMKLAYEAHAGQTDQTGVPYIFHPIHLAEQMTDETATCVALLHDVVEDTPVSLDDLKKAGFPQEVTDEVKLLTHDPADEYLDYVRAIRESPVARRVKEADLKHNMDESRLVGSAVTQEQRRHWTEKYMAARRVLEEKI